MFLHQAKHFGRTAVAVFDRFDSRERCAPHAFRGRGMCGDGNVRAFRCLDDEFQFVE